MSKTTHSAEAKLLPNADWSDCRASAAMSENRISEALVVIRVRVDAEGRPEHVHIVSDPGYDLGEAARKCAMGKRYIPAREPGARPRSSWTLPFRVRFFDH
ncbi:MAG: energy transducer TonB [Labilithrix sp.]|nr:energy transducer TonB [Labilithrix sp.]MCW5836841.1 energy transducer TonB [Labilithrix sp.]